MKNWQPGEVYYCPAVGLKIRVLERPHWKQHESPVGEAPCEALTVHVGLADHPGTRFYLAETATHGAMAVEDQ